MQHEVCVTAGCRVQWPAAAGVCNDQVDGEHTVGDFYIEPPRFLGKPHKGTLGCQGAVDIHLKPHARVCRQESSIRILTERVVVHASPCDKPVIAGLNLIQTVAWSAHTHSLDINGFADTQWSAGECQIGVRMPYPIRPRAFEGFELIEVNVRFWR